MGAIAAAMERWAALRTRFAGFGWSGNLDSRAARMLTGATLALAVATFACAVLGYGTAVRDDGRMEIERRAGL